MTYEEKEDIFWFYWSGCIRTFQLDSVEWSVSNNDFEMDGKEKMACAPTLLGFVDKSPMQYLTPAGEALVSSRRKDEVFLRQMLKFQIPSPYHIPTEKATTFCVKPYLELLRLVREMGTLKFDELRLFGMQLTDWRKFDEIVRKIEKFRQDKLEHKGSYSKFYVVYTKTELKRIYSQRIARGETKTRESKDKSLETFLETQSRNMRDYADACFRYLRVTGLVNVSHVGKSLSIIPERQADVDFILRTISREPSNFGSEEEYISYLGNATTPLLYTDDKAKLLQRLAEEFPTATIDSRWDVEKLKDVLADNIEKRKKAVIEKQVKEIKDYKLYDDIQHVFQQIVSEGLYDAPLMLEWNTWRAMTMLDGGNIKANLNFDDFGMPMSTAQGNMADIVCDYGDFKVVVEVTMLNGYKQFEKESEPVSRHVGRLKTSCNMPCYCLFVAPTINDACISYFFGLHHININYYGGKSVIVPLPLDVFQKMLEDSYKANFTPNPSHVKHFFEQSIQIANSGCSETEWYEKMKQAAVNWL